MNKPKTLEEAVENFSNACREFARVVRKAIFCSRGIHCRMKYDSELVHDYLGARSCQDCGYRKETRMPPDMPRVKPPKKDKMICTNCGHGRNILNLSTWTGGPL